MILTPGGEVAGAFDTADLIARREQKPVWALASDTACSAAYLLASACSRRLITQTGTVGSIGVLMAHRCVEKALEIAGVDVTLIYAGAHKVDGNPYSQLPGDVRDEFQLSINSTREQFAQKVSDYTGLKNPGCWPRKLQYLSARTRLNLVPLINSLITRTLSQ